MTTLIMGRYEVIGLIGSGGIGQVYATRDQALGRFVAIKALRPEYSSDRTFLERFHAEAASLARLSHPNVATLYDLQADGQQLYMVMELVRGHTLEAVLARMKQIGIRESLAITAQTVAGLSYAHKMGVIHRDIKPSNIMLSDSGILKIMDFGIARVRGSQRLTRTGSIIGTLAYVAPEQIKGGEGDERSDLYGLACVLYEMLSGDPPFNADTEYELIRAHVDASPKALITKIPNLPAALNKALMRALEKDPKDRFGSVEEFGRALGTEAISGQSVDILQDNVLAIMGPLSEPKKVADMTPILGNLSSHGGHKKNIPPSLQLVRGYIKRFWQRIKTFKLKHASIVPVVVLGSVTALVLIIFGFIAINSGWWSSTPQTPSGPTLSIANKSSFPTDQHQQTQPPLSSLILPPPGSQSIKAPSDSPSQASANRPLNSDQLVSGPLPLPGESPAYRGRVSDWPGPNLIAVPMNGSFGLKFLKLYGILDASTNNAQTSQDHIKMKSFLAASGNVIICYARGEATFQCYANNQDIALWAVKNGFAKPTPDAPKEYQEGNE